MCILVNNLNPHLRGDTNQVRISWDIRTFIEKKTNFFRSGITRLDTIDLSPEMLSYALLGSANTSRSSGIDPVTVSGGHFEGILTYFSTRATSRVCTALLLVTVVQCTL